MYTTVIFDWDGTLAMTMHALLRAFKTVLIKKGLFFTDEQIIIFIFGNWINGLKYFAVPNAEQVVREVQKEYEKQEVELYPGAREVIARLVKQNKRVIVLKEGDLDAVNRILKVEVEVFDKRVFFNQEVGHSQMLWVGNSMNDWEMGKSAGIDTLVYYPTENEKFGNNKVFEGMRVIRELKEII